MNLEDSANLPKPNFFLLPPSSPPTHALCGVWVNPGSGEVYCAKRSVLNKKGEILSAPSFTSSQAQKDFITIDDSFQPFLWSSNAQDTHPFSTDTKKLQSFSDLRYCTYFKNPSDYFAFLKGHSTSENGLIDYIRTLEEQYLLQKQYRLFEGLDFTQLKRLQLDIETFCSIPGGFSHSQRLRDRILTIGLWSSQKSEPDYLTLEEDSDIAEKKLLESLNAYLAQEDPDVIEGHNIFKFDLDYLRQRCLRLKVEMKWGRFDQAPQFRKTRFRVAERWLDYPRCDIPGRAVFDTFFLVQLYDLTTREMKSYSLKEVALHLGVTDPDLHKRTYLKAHQIQEAFYQDRQKFLAYLGDDLRETRGLADILLPTYFAQTKNFPTTLHECTLRGTGHKIDLLFLEKYYHEQNAIPLPKKIPPFEGGYTRSFVKGVFKKVLHFDIASLYPSLLMHINKNPKSDTLGVFIPLLQQLRTYRLHYKMLAKRASDPTLKREYEARQASFKILINSFYGYLAFEGAHFGDSELAAEVTLQGRQLLQSLIERLQSLNSVILEADTDGIYLTNEAFYDKPEDLLKIIQSELPPGIDLELDGRYESMFCYKAKNYALYDGQEITIRGSALRSRGIEPFLKELTQRLIQWTLGLSQESIGEYIRHLKNEISSQHCNIEFLAKTEFLSQNPTAYKKALAEGSKVRRASLEVACRLQPEPSMGDPLTYYIAKIHAKRASDWERALALSEYDPINTPYDSHYYIGKIEEWVERYQEFLPGQQTSDQITFDFL